MHKSLRVHARECARRRLTVPGSVLEIGSVQGLSLSGAGERSPITEALLPNPTVDRRRSSTG